MNQKFYSLIRTLLPHDEILAIDQREKMCMRCYYFIKKEIALMPIFYRLPIRLLIQLFFAYCFVYSGFKAFKKLPKEKQERLIIGWENKWHPGYKLLQLLRSLVFLCYFDKTPTEFPQTLQDRNN